MEEQKIIYIDINKLIPNRYQPRKIFNENSLQELASSIKHYGIINPIIVRKNNQQYEIIAGERRWRAAKKVNLQEVPVLIKNIDDSRMAEIALIENLERENLTPIEEAKAISDIMALSKLTQFDVGKILGKSQSAIANKLRLLNLPDKVQDAINNKQISERHARALLSVDNKDRQIELLDMIIKNKMTVKQLEELIKEEENNMKYDINNINNKEEEKESDKMNQGNFFPNYNNINNNVNNNTRNNINNNISDSNMNNSNMSLNTLNNQIASNSSQKTSQNQYSQNIEIPSIEPQVNSTINPPIDNITPLYNLNQNQTSSSFQNNVGNTQPPVDNTLNQMSQQSFIDAPIFKDQNIVENINPVSSQNQNRIFEENNIHSDAPIFTMTENNLAKPSEKNLPNIDTALNLSKSSSNKYEQIKDFLNSKGIDYKLYSNEKSNCIIIEIEKEQN